MQFLRIISAVVCLCCAFFLFISLFSYHALDAAALYVSLPEQTCLNWCGRPGAQVSAWLLFLFGSAAYLWIPFCAGLGLYLGLSEPSARRKSSLVACALLVPLLSLVFCSTKLELHPEIRPGGIAGQLLLQGVSRIIDITLLPLMLFFMAWGLVMLVVGFSWVVPCTLLLRRICCACKLDYVWLLCAQQLTAWHAFFAQQVHRYGSALKKVVWHEKIPPSDRLEDIVYDAAFWKEHGAEQQELVQEQLLDAAVTAVDEKQADALYAHNQAPQATPYAKPDVTVFQQKRSELTKADKHEQQNQAQVLEEKLQRFGIKGSVLNITAGPVVTLFEYQPHIDVPISKIIAREDDLALALQAMSLRIIAPIPGKSVIGFEVANAKRKMVLFSESVNAPTFTHHDGQLPFIIGQNTIGEQVVIDLAKMPHILVAGSTGSGKSVALNAMLLSLLCKATPDEVRMILIDPKRLEFAAYTDIPHLIFPIIVDPHSALSVLQWAIATMEKRYEQMAAAGVRNIYDYRALNKDTMPSLIIVIDELADLMMVAGKDIETAIARLAQMARASGIHLVLATQRPSVDVITGVVKVNFPARLACKVISKIDSRTILDAGGAEKLLGKGDMLFLDPQGKVHRLHGAYVTDQEIAHIVHHIKAQRPVSYEQLPESTKDCTLQGEDAALYKELLDFVKTVDEISISLLQRRFRIGYNRSARFIDVLEAQGIIMPSAGGKTRKVLH